MHAIMAAVLLRVAGLDALDLDAEPQPLDGKLGEVEEGIRTGEGDAVVGADGRAAKERRETKRQGREDAECLVVRWNERQIKRMPLLHSPTTGAALAEQYWYLWVPLPGLPHNHERRSAHH
jgi:hypothetical protein